MAFFCLPFFIKETAFWTVLFVEIERFSNQKRSSVRLLNFNVASLPKVPWFIAACHMALRVLQTFFESANRFPKLWTFRFRNLEFAFSVKFIDQTAHQSVRSIAQINRKTVEWAPPNCLPIQFAFHAKWSWGLFSYRMNHWQATCLGVQGLNRWQVVSARFIN